jgi:hypothetical protein
VDEYRWKLFEHLEQVFANGMLDSLWVLGDLTEFKDYHSSRLVNRIIDSFWRLRTKTKLNEIHIVKGNHDGVDPNTPYFLFLNRIPWIRFYHKPTVIDFKGEKIAVLPHSTKPEEDWGEIELGNPSFILTHATFSGAEGENGVRLSGLPPDLFDGIRAKVFSGDIHVPQKVGRVEYIGSPYPIRFGDSFEGRTITFPLGKRKDIPLPNIRKAKARIRSVEDLKAVSLSKGDMLKVELELRESEIGRWHKEKRDILNWCKRKGIILAGIELKRSKLKRMRVGVKFQAETPGKIVERYCRARDVDASLTQIGVDLVDDDGTQ